MRYAAGLKEGQDEVCSCCLLLWLKAALRREGCLAQDDLVAKELGKCVSPSSSGCCRKI